MRHTIKSLRWQAQWWTKKPTSWPGASVQLLEGMHAYAMKQADIQRDLAASFKLLWETPLAEFDNNNNGIQTGVPSTEENDDDDDSDAEFSDDKAKAEDLENHV